MGIVKSSHPTEQTLQSYSLGMLDELAAESVAEHLAECPECRRRAGEVSGDSFLNRLRAARTPGSELPSVSSLATADTGPRKVVKPPAIAPRSAALPRDLVDHPGYENVRELGRGGMGVVYLARNRLMGRDEVLKVVSTQLMERQGVLDRFGREIRAAARLNHPNIVAAYSAFRTDESIVFAMEYIEGLDLARLVKAKGPLPVAHACYFVYQTALGLQHAHEHGMVHRDIKPGNLMLSRHGDRAEVKVLDFGLAKATSERSVEGGLTHEGQMLGTPDFIAPEQTLDARNADIRADIYSLGCTLYYLLTGGPPFRGTSLYDILQAHQSMDADLLNVVRPEVPTSLAALVAKMMAKQPARRFQTPAEVAKALTPFFKEGRGAPLIPVAGPAAATLPPGGARASDRDVPATQPATSPPPTLVPPCAELGWGEKPEHAHTEPFLEPEPTLASDGRPPRSVRPIAVAASFFGLLALGVIITIKIKNGETTIRVETDSPTSKTAGDDRSPAVPAPPSDTPAVVRTASFDREEFRHFYEGGGQWYAEGDELIVTRKNGDVLYFPLLLFGDPEWTDYDFTVDAMRVEGLFGFALVVRGIGSNDRYEFRVQGRSWDESSLLLFERDKESELGKIASRLVTHRWYTARVSVRGKHIQCFLSDGTKETKLFDVENPTHEKGRVGLVPSWSGFRFKNIKVTAPDGTILWEGPPAVGPKPPIAVAADSSLGSATNSLGMTLKLIPAGTFEMGAADDEARPDGSDGSKPRHRVRITRPFYLSAHEVSQEQYLQVMGVNPSAFKGLPNMPVDSVTWSDAIAFCNRLSAQEAREPYYRVVGKIVTVAGGDGYRLPTEAEWEYACRAGTTTRYSFGDDAKRLSDYAWIGNWSGDTPHPVGLKPPNGFGLYDMHGNLAEWCWDWFSDTYYQLGVTDDPQGPKDGVTHVHRGGTFLPRDGRFHYYTSAHRGGRPGVPPNPSASLFGFRVARTAAG